MGLFKALFLKHVCLVDIMCLWNDSRFSVLWQFLNHLFPLWKYLCSLFIYIVPAGSYLCDIPAWMTAQSVPDQAYLCYVVDVWRHSQLMSCSWRMTVQLVPDQAYLCHAVDVWRHICVLCLTNDGTLRAWWYTYSLDEWWHRSCKLLCMFRFDVR